MFGLLTMGCELLLVAVVVVVVVVVVARVKVFLHSDALRERPPNTQ